MDSQDAIAGIFITLEHITSGMRQIAEDMGTFEHINNKKYPRLQFWQIDENYFKNKNLLKDTIKLPREWIQPRKKSERYFEDVQMELLSESTSTQHN